MAADMVGAVDMAAGQSLASRATERRDNALEIIGGCAASRLETRVHMTSELEMMQTPTATITSISPTCANI